MGFTRYPNGTTMEEWRWYTVISAKSLCASREDGKKREADWRLNRIEPWIFRCSRLGFVIVLISRLFSFLHSEWEWATFIDWLGFLGSSHPEKVRRCDEEREAMSSWGKPVCRGNFAAHWHDMLIKTEFEELFQFSHLWTILPWNTVKKFWWQILLYSAP